tara:strand:+ start:22626 stop:23405 length:780 start_codon:yes stop_codon:yes gene_type:complete
MVKETTVNYFGALPGRVCNDKRLTALHFKVLMAVAVHDRMGRNGQCCWAGRKKLTSRVGCDPSSFSSAISDLVEMEYLQEERHEKDGRKKGYRVVYKRMEDANGIGIELKTNRFPDENLNTTESRFPVENLNTGDRFPDENPYIGDNSGIVEQKQCDDSQEPKPNILSRNLRYKSEDLKYGCEHPKYGLQKHHQEGQKKLYGARTHPTIVRAFGPEGWEILTNLPQPTLEYLEQRVTDGTLDGEDVMRARGEARIAAHG